MKKKFYILILIGFSCFGQVNSNNSDSNKNDEVISFNKVDQIPLFKNCKNLKKDLQRDCVVNFINAHIEKNLKYPEEAKKVNVESKVFCTFIIDKKGKVKRSFEAINLMDSGQYFKLSNSDSRNLYDIVTNPHDKTNLPLNLFRGISKETAGI